MSNCKHRFFVLTGDPGVGKTTLIKKLLPYITSKGIKTSGFYTEEVRKNGVREGFDVVTLDGTRGRLARDQAVVESAVKCRVGKYAVLVPEFEFVALPCLTQMAQTHPHLLVIDEIGKMEFFSGKFRQIIRNLLSDSSHDIVLVTIPVRQSDTIIETIRNHSKSKLWTVTKENRNKIHEDILKEIKTVFNIDTSVK